MTGFEAAILEERDALVRRRRDAQQAQEDEDYRLQYREEAVERITERHSQQQQPSEPPPSSIPISISKYTLLQQQQDREATTVQARGPEDAKAGRQQPDSEGSGSGEVEATAQTREEGIGGGSGDVAAARWVYTGLLSISEWITAIHMGLFHIWIKLFHIWNS
jgi:hypothetical protein